MPLTLALDTSAFEHAAFDFDGEVLRAVQRACEQGRLKLVVVDLTAAEVEQRIRHRVREAIGNIKKAYVLKSCGIPSFNGLFDERTLQSSEAALVARWHRYLEECGTEIVKVREADPMGVFADYFARRPPFSRSKPGEFRDAFVLASLVSLADPDFNVIRVCSVDGDFRGFCATRRDLVFHESIGKALEEALSDEALDNDVGLQCALRENEFRLEIRKEFDQLHGSLSGRPDATVERVTAVSLQHDLGTALIDVLESEYEVEGEVTVNFRAEVKVPEIGGHDDGPYGPYSFVRYTGARKVEFSARVGALPDQCPIRALRLIDPRVLVLSDVAGDVCEIVDPFADDAAQVGRRNHPVSWP